MYMSTVFYLDDIALDDKRSVMEIQFLFGVEYKCSFSIRKKKENTS